jgi:hypothetical protein
VTNITGIPTTAAVGTLSLHGNVVPSTATSRNISWSIIDAGTTGAWLTGGNTLNTAAPGNVTIRATISNGLAIGSSYTQNFTINVGGGGSTGGGTPVTSITLTSPRTVLEGGTLTLTGTINPSAAGVQRTIAWSVHSPTDSPASIVNVNTLVTGNTPADTIVTVRATVAGGKADGTHYTEDFDITVNPIRVTGVSISPSSLTLKVGDITPLTANVTPANATNTSVRWESTDDDIAKVEDGVVTAVAPGVATIIVITNDGLRRDFCRVTVHGVVHGITIAPSTVPLNATGNANRTGQLTLTITLVGSIDTNEAVSVSRRGSANENTTEHSNNRVRVGVHWRSSNTSIATVAVGANGVVTVTAVAAGETEIIAMTDCGKFASIKITVNP